MSETTPDSIGEGQATELSEIDVSETELLPLAEILYAKVLEYNQWVQAVNAGTATLADSRATMRGLLQEIESMARTAFDSLKNTLGAIGAWIEQGWLYELGQLINACTTARNQLGSE